MGASAVYIMEDITFSNLDDAKVHCSLVEMCDYVEYTYDGETPTNIKLAATSDETLYEGNNYYVREIECERLDLNIFISGKEGEFHWQLLDWSMRFEIANSHVGVSQYSISDIPIDKALRLFIYDADSSNGIGFYTNGEEMRGLSLQVGTELLPFAANNALNPEHNLGG